MNNFEDLTEGRNLFCGVFVVRMLQKKLNISLAEAQEYVKKFGRKSKSEDSDAEENG